MYELYDDLVVELDRLCEVNSWGQKMQVHWLHLYIYSRYPLNPTKEKSSILVLIPIRLKKTHHVTHLKFSDML
jgi:hypothetical protein